MNLLRKLARHKIPFIAGFTLVLFCAIASLIGSVMNLFSISGEREAVIMLALRNSPILMFIIFFICLAASYFICAVMRKEEKKDSRGFLVSENGIMGSSYFMSDEEKRAFFNLTKMNGKDNIDPQGLILGKEQNSGEVIARPWKEKDYLNRFPNNNVVLVGGAGSGKTSSFLLPALFEFMRMGYSVICTDPKGELYRETYALSQAAGYHVNVINLLEGQFQYSDGMDLIKLVRESMDPQTTADVMAKQLILNFQGENKGKDNFWLLANLNCLKLAILYVSHAKGFTSTVQPNTSGTRRTLEAVYDVISRADFEATIQADLAAHPEDKTFLQKPFDTWSGHSQKDSIRTGLSTALGLLQNKMLARILSEDDISYQSFNDRPTILYIISSDQNTTFRGILTTITTFLFDEIAKIADSHTPAALDRPLYFLFEELFSIGKIPDIVEKVSTLRSRGVGMLFCLQDIVHLKVRYEELYETILSNCSIKLFLGGDGITTTTFFRDLTGTMTAVNEEASRSHEENDALFNIRQSVESRVSSSVTGRNVMLSDEISKIRIDELLIFPVGRDFLKEKKFFYKEHYYYGFKLVDQEGNIITHTPTMRKPAWRLKMEMDDYRATIGQDLHYDPTRYDVKYFPEFVIKPSNKPESAPSNKFFSMLFEEEKDGAESPAGKSIRKTSKTFNDFIKKDGEEEMDQVYTSAKEEMQEEDMERGSFRVRKRPSPDAQPQVPEEFATTEPADDDAIFGDDIRF